MQGALLYATFADGRRAQVLRSTESTDFAESSWWWSEYLVMVIIIVCGTGLCFAAFSLISFVFNGYFSHYIEEGIVIFNGDVTCPSETQTGLYIINPAITDTSLTPPTSQTTSTIPPPPASNRTYSYLLDEPRGAVAMSFVVQDDEAAPRGQAPLESHHVVPPQPLLPVSPPLGSGAAEREPIVHSARDLDADGGGAAQAGNEVPRQQRHLHNRSLIREWRSVAPFAMNFPFAHQPPPSPMSRRTMRQAHRRAMQRRRKLQRTYEKQCGPYDGFSVSMLYLPDSFLFEKNRLQFYWAFHTYFGDETQMGTPYFDNATSLDVDDSSSESTASDEGLRSREEDEHGTYTRWRTNRPYLYTCNLEEHPAYIPRSGDESERSFVIVGDSGGDGSRIAPDNIHNSGETQSPHVPNDGTTSVFVTTQPEHATVVESTANADP